MPLLSPELLSKRVIDMLTEAHVSFRLLQHASEGRCEEVSKLRGNHPSEAVKAMLVTLKISNTKKTRALALLPGNAHMNFTALANQLRVKSVGMAIRQDVIDWLDSEPGGVSPFSFNSQIPVLLDQELLKVRHVFFSAGKTDESITMPSEDFRKISILRGGQVLSFCKLAEEQPPDAPSAESAATIKQPSPRCRPT